jgi:hypothetical protein
MLIQHMEAVEVEGQVQYEVMEHLQLEEMDEQVRQIQYLEVLSHTQVEEVQVHITDEAQQEHEVHEVEETHQNREVEVMVQQIQEAEVVDELLTLDDKQYEYDETVEAV